MRHRLPTNRSGLQRGDLRPLADALIRPPCCLDVVAAPRELSRQTKSELRPTRPLSQVYAAAHEPIIYAAISVLIFGPVPARPLNVAELCDDAG
jgi:hypothetical protein